MKKQFYIFIILFSLLNTQLTAKDNNMIGTEYLRKIWRVDHEATERTLGVSSQRCAIMDSPSLGRSY